jgi:hypothetical protein
MPPSGWREEISQRMQEGSRNVEIVRHTLLIMVPWKQARETEGRMQAQRQESHFPHLPPPQLRKTSVQAGREDAAHDCLVPVCPRMRHTCTWGLEVILASPLPRAGLCLNISHDRQLTALRPSAVRKHFLWLDCNLAPRGSPTLRLHRPHLTSVTRRFTRSPGRRETQQS